MNRVEIKEKAKKIISNNLWTIWKPLLIIIAINAVLSLIFTSVFPARDYYLFNSTISYQVNYADSILTIILAPLYIGYTLYVLNFIRGKKLDIKDIFSKMNYILPIWGVSILVSIFSSIGFALLIVPGIIISLMLAMTNYIMADGETGVIDTLKKSKELTDGYKWDLFIFGLSFIGWFLLVIITFGIAIIYVGPYLSVAYSLYYEELRKIKKIK